MPYCAESAMRNESQLIPQNLFSPRHHAGRAVGPEVEPAREHCLERWGPGSRIPTGRAGPGKGQAALCHNKKNLMGEETSALQRHHPRQLGGWREEPSRWMFSPKPQSLQKSKDGAQTNKASQLRVHVGSQNMDRNSARG